MIAALNPRDVYKNFPQYLSHFTAVSDADIEDQFFERKEIPKPANGNVPRSVIQGIKDKIKETVSAFSNANPEGGLLIIGISKTGNIIGINHLTDSQRNDLCNIGLLLSNQSSSVRLQDCMDSDGVMNKLLLVFAPYISNAICETVESVPRAWKRSGAQNLPLTDRDRDQFKRDKQIENFERRKASRYDAADVDQGLLSEIKKTWPEITDIDRSDEDLLYELGAIERDENGINFTNSGLLYFAFNPQRSLPQAQIRILRYESMYKDSNVGDPTLDRTFTGSITKQLLSVREFLRESGLIRVFYIRQPDGGFEERLEIPFIVVDEAIVNAVAHRDYALEWAIECKYYRDAIVISNPGRLLQRNGVVPPSFNLDERSLVSTPRNPVLLNWLKQSKDQKGERFVRALSEGTRTMLRTMSEANLPPPQYIVTDTETTVVLKVDTSVHQQSVERASEFSNLYPISITGSLSSDWRRAALATLRDKLESVGWFIDRFAHGRISAHKRGNEFPLSEVAREIVRIFPACILTFREIQNRRYLTIDHSVEVKNVIRLIGLESRGLRPSSFVGRRVMVQTKDEWCNAQIEEIGSGDAKVHLYDYFRSEIVSFDKIIPNLNIREIRQLLAHTNFDLSSEIKRRSFAAITAAARKRADVVQMIATDFAEKIFPLKVGGNELMLSTSPARLDSSSSLLPRSLAEPLVEFGRHRETSNIREGITEFGAFSHEENEIELVPIVAEENRVQMQALIERLKSGKYKYKGSERTFGIRFTFSSIVSVHPSESIVSTCQRIVSERTDLPGDPKLKRIFLVHTPEAEYALDDEHSPYFETKRFLLETGIPCQMVDTPTLVNPDWKDLNLALNISAKCGVVPWVLPEGIPDADFFVGLSYTQHRGDPASRLMGYANVFNQYGRWLFYSGNVETFLYNDRGKKFAELVENTLARLENLPQTPHIFFHYSARFSKEDRDAIVEAARRVRPDGTYSFVWINSHHPIRLYDERPESDGSLARGTYIVTGKNQLYISTTGYNPYRKALGTPLPLEITIWSYSPVNNSATPPDLHALARQILALTKLNWASSDALAGEPITTKYAGDIAYLTAAFMRQKKSFRLHKALERTPWFL